MKCSCGSKNTGNDANTGEKICLDCGNILDEINAVAEVK